MPLPKIAVIADPHFHDIAWRPEGWPDAPGAVRTLADTIESTRVFNESYHALPAMLDDIVSRGIRLVVVAGDLSDDGQAHTIAAAAAVLRDYSARHGLRFFATPGNHDLFAIHGRHQSKRFLNAEGTHTLVTSDAGAPQNGSVAKVVTATMHCGGYDAALRAMAPFGFFRDRRDLHWESPFDSDDRLEARTFEIRSADGRTVRRMIDASYLVEPEPGLWLLSIDANVFEPRDGDLDPAVERSYIDSTDAGWNSMLRNKPFILDWMKDVADRAARQGKQLIAFSHYPMIDPLAGTSADEKRLLGDAGFLLRAPVPAVAEAAAATGIKVHFSGHLHLNDTAACNKGGRFLVNVSVPSAAAFPSAYKTVHAQNGSLRVETITVANVPSYDAAFTLYATEAARTGKDYRSILASTSHGDYLSRHLGALTAQRHLPREWPPGLARLVPRLTLADLWRLADAAPRPPDDALPDDAGMGPAGMGDVPFMEMVADWYRLRKGRALAFDFIARERLPLYRSLADRYRNRDWPEGTLQSLVASFARMFTAYATGLPSRDFTIDLATGLITDADAR
jgi:3',5'-cyclic AMP phosphodiesterase CpdA